MSPPPDMGLTPTRVRSDDAMSLLSRVVEDALDPGYTHAAGRSIRSHPRSSWTHSLALFAALLALGALIAAAVIQARQGAPAAAQTRSDLIQRVAAATSQTDALASTVDDMTAQEARLRSRALSGSAADQQLNDRLIALEGATGVRSVTGPGVEVVLTDGPPQPAAAGGPDLARVLDQDLQLTVNGLFASGAEAVSINGQRLTSLTAIRGAGDAVLVGYRPLSSPYVVTAIGNPDTMIHEFDNSAAAAQLRALVDNYGIGFDVSTQEELTLPGRPELSLRYARPGKAS